MTADLRQIVIFGHFTFLHISHPNQQRCTIQGSCGQLVVIFFILKGFPESRKNWRFSWPQTCEKNVILGISHFSQPNQQICVFQGSCSELVVIFIIFKGFPESQKIWRVSWLLTCEKNFVFGHFTFLHISHRNQQICTFQGSCGQLVVVYIIFKGFPESRKIWRFFKCLRTCEKNVIFGHFTFLHISHPNQQICKFQGSCVQLVVVFIIFKGFPENQKIWRFSCPRTCEKNVIFGHFTFLHISHPNQQLCTFQGSCCQLVVIFIILNGFPESRKIWRFSWQRTCEENVIFEHFTFLHFSHPNQQICTLEGSCGQLVVVFIIFKGFPEK